MHKAILVAVVAYAVLLAGCEEQNVTTVPAYHFAAVAGTTWKTRVPVVLEPGPRGMICTEEYASSFAAGKADRRALGGNVTDVLPTGTLIRIDSLINNGGSLGGQRVEVTVQSGKRAGTQFVAPHELFMPNQFLGGPDEPATWAVNPKVLEKP